MGLYLGFLAIGLLIEALIAIPIFIRVLLKTNTDYFLDQVMFLILNISNFVITFLLARWMIFKTEKIVKWITKPSDDEETMTLSVDRKTIYEMVLVIAGLLMLMHTFPVFLWKLKGYFDLRSISKSLFSNMYPFDLIVIIKLVLGVLAIVFSKIIAEYLSKKNNKTI